MKKWMKWSWAAAAAIFLALALCSNQTPELNPLVLLAQPFILVGQGLRALSLSGSIGNIAAYVLYVLLSGAPMILAGMRKKRSALSVLLSAYLFFLMYMMVNPSIWLNHLNSLGASEAIRLYSMAIPALPFYAILLSWLVLRAARARETGRVVQVTSRLLWVFGAALLFNLFYTDILLLKSALSSMATAETSFWLPMADSLPGLSSSQPDASAARLLLRLIALALPAIAVFAILPPSIRLIDGCGQTLFCEENVTLAKIVMRRAKTALTVSVVCMVGRVLLELALAGHSGDTQLTAELPLMELFFSLAASLFARFLESGYRVYRENQMMI